MKVLTKEDIVAKIKAAESKYYKENPCFHCGPGNGCDDCRGCEDAKKSWELGNELSKAKKEYEQRFGHSYAQDCDYEQIVKKEEEYNKEFGKQIAEVADYAILIGEKQTKPIKEGLLEKEFDKEKIIVFNDVREAYPFISTLATNNEVYALFENDLPDTYNEK